MSIKSTTFLSIILLQFVAINTLIAQTDSISSEKINVEYTKKGLQFSTPDKNYSLHSEARLQFRFATPNDQITVNFDDLFQDNKTSFKINRDRLKIGGDAHKPWRKYYFEYELAPANLLYFRVM